MVVIVVRCAHCDSPDLVKNGHAPNGKQKYRCRACGRQSRENPTPRVTPHERREEILRAYQERRLLRGLARTFEVSRNSVTAWIKKSSQPAAAGRDAATSGELGAHSPDLGVG